MHLTSLQLKSFRNFEHLTLECHPQFNFVFGKNAQGKTNIIEAIYYLSQLKSFRTNDKNSLILKNSEFAKVFAKFQKDSFDWEIDITLSAKGRQLYLNGKRPKLKKDYFGLIPVVLFEPGDIYLFRSSPGGRRRYLDRALFLQDPDYLNLVLDYGKVITQKNKLLKQSQNPNRDLLDVWNEKLCDLGSQIIVRRNQWFQNIAQELAAEYEAISHAGQTLNFKYICHALDSDDLERQIEISDMKDKLAQKLQEKSSLELMRRESLVGPHRDDFQAYLDDREIGQFGSQGENRSAIIALKLAQLKMYEQKYQKTPLFLLDDVASELDESRCEYLFSYLRDESTQAFITTTEHRIQGADFTGYSRSFLVECGSVKVLER